MSNSNTGKVVERIDPKALPAFGGESACAKRRARAREAARLRARRYKIEEAMRRRKAKEDEGP